MHTNFNGMTIHCLPGALTNQPGIDALIVFADTWLRPIGEQAERIHAIGGSVLRGACADAAPLTLGKIAKTNSCGLPNRALFHCVVASLDRPEPTDELIGHCYRQALHRANEAGHRSVAFAPSPVQQGGDEDRGKFSAILSALDDLPTEQRHIDLVRIIVTDGLSYKSYARDVAREVSRRQRVAA
jgi:O-acetyl-ADP-ribose deacetylase (regulator of RNase III)